MLFALLHKEIVIGLYDDYNMCENMKTGLIGNDFVKGTDIRISAFQNNTINCIKSAFDVYGDSDSYYSSLSELSDVEQPLQQPTKQATKRATVEQPSKQPTKQATVEQPILPVKVETKEQRIKREEKEKRRYERQKKREYNLNILKKRKERLEEQKKIFEVDLNLYYKFKELLEKDPSFVLPDMFEKKYSIMLELEEMDKLNCDDFYTVYNREPIPNKWAMLFDGCDKPKEYELLEVSSDTQSE